MIPTERASTSTAGPAPVPRTAPVPKTAPAATPPALLLGLTLIGVGALCIRELIVHAELVDSAPWLANSAVWIAQLQWRNWMMGAAPAATLGGLILLIAALKPRQRTHVQLQSVTDIWLRPTDIARLCSAAAFEEPEVLTATTTVTKQRTEVTVTAAHPSGPLSGDGTQIATADPEFAALATALRERISVRVTALVAELAAPMSVLVTVGPGVAHAPRQRRRVI